MKHLLQLFLFILFVSPGPSTAQDQQTTPVDITIQRQDVILQGKF